MSRKDSCTRCVAAVDTCGCKRNSSMVRELHHAQHPSANTPGLRPYRREHESRPLVGVLRPGLELTGRSGEPPSTGAVAEVCLRSRCLGLDGAALLRRQRWCRARRGLSQMAQLTAAAAIVGWVVQAFGVPATQTGSQKTSQGKRSLSDIASNGHTAVRRRVSHQRMLRAQPLPEDRSFQLGHLGGHRLAHRRHRVVLVPL